MEFQLNGQAVAIDDVEATTTLLQLLRVHMRRVGTKEVCAEGDCGACTVVLVDVDHRGEPTLRAVNSCLILAPMVAGRQVWTVEGLANGGLHPAQKAMVDALGSQCGYCTPGIVMSMAEAAHRVDLDSAWKLEDQLCGNLCRCTGYRPIREAAARIAGCRPDDVLSRALPSATAAGAEVYDGDAGVYRRPATLATVFDLLDELPEARIVCGATDVGLDVTKRRNTWSDVIDLSAVRELGRIETLDGGWRIGATVRLADLESWSETRLPPLARMLRFFGSRQIKHQGSIGGNLCTASPIGDLAPVLIALGATAVIAGRGGERRVPLDEFFPAYRQTALQAGEVLAFVEVDAVPADVRALAYKVSKRRELDISAVSAGFYVRVDDGVVVEARLAYGGMAATPARARGAEAALLGRTWTAESVEQAVSALDFTPMSDHRGSAWYRSTVAANLLRGFFQETRASGMPALPDFPSGTVQEVR